MEPAALGTIPLFAGLTAEQRVDVAGACRKLEIEEGATLLREGDFGYAMFAITSGTAAVLKDETVVRALGPGDVFGEIAVLSGGRRTATVVATSAMRVLAVMNRDVWRLERNAPDVVDALRTTIADCLDRSGTPA